MAPTKPINFYKGNNRSEYLNKHKKKAKNIYIYKLKLVYDNKKSI